MEVLKICHVTNNHPGSERTLLFFLKQFYSDQGRTDLLLMCKNICDACSVCILAKPNRAQDRGEISCLPIPQICNDILHIDIIAMDAYNNFDYVLTIVDALTRFTMFLPCQKNITGEGVLKLILERWITPYGKPCAIHSDNDVRFKSQKGFYQTAFKALGIETHFALPRHPGSNGLCENENKAFIQNMRALSLTMKTMNWPQLVPYCNWLMNSQFSPSTQMTPHELFLGRPSWRLELVPEPILNPDTHGWLMDQLLIQEKVAKRLQRLREISMKRANKGRSPNTFEINDYVLVHKKRWPQHNYPKLSSPWIGPFKVTKVKFNSLQVMASPSLGGLIEVAIHMCKKWVINLMEESVLTEPNIEDEIDLTDFNPSSSSENSTSNPPMEDVMTVDEQAALGYYNVAKIIKHKFQNGWKFLVVWEGFPISASTWEPITAFLLPNGSVNSIFKEYCETHDLSNVLAKSLSRFLHCDTQTSCHENVANC